MPQSTTRLTPVTPIRLLRGWKALMRLGRNYEDTSAVFEVYHYLNGASFDATVELFSRTEVYRKLKADPYYVTRALSDSNALRALPTDTLGYIYLRELDSEGLDPAAVQNAAISAFDDLSLSSDVSRDFPEFHSLFLMLNWTHDLVHTLTGYGRDPMGEIAIHQFMHAQGTGHGSGWMAHLGALSLLREHSPQLVARVMKHAQNIGRRAQNLSLIDLVAELERPLNEVRARLGLTLDPAYFTFRRIP